MMTNFGKLCALVFGMVCAIPATAGDSPIDPTWPLDMSTRYLTSNFMEFRGGRFHAGLDLKTRSREGFTVRAVEDGYISRVRCTPTAYGRVVYLRGVSGKTYVFAHLARFNDDLRARLEMVQNQNDTYRARLEFKPGQIPIFKGQVLGISGQSGTGGPHLHFEVRDSSQRPLNPLANGFAVLDTLPPVIHNLRAWPVTPASRINGEKGEWVLGSKGAPGLSGDQGVLNITGPIAFSARMVDASDIRGHKLEPWLIELTLDDELVYRCQNDRYAFSENALQRLEWTDAADWTGESVPREHWLHRRKANTLTGREGGLWYLGDRGEGLSFGDHSLVLLVRDHAGGEASVRWILRVQKETTSPQDTQWREHSLGITLSDSVGTRLTPFFSSGDPEKAGFTVYEIEPGKQGTVLEKTELWVRSIEASASFFEVAAGQGLVPVGPAVLYMTADWPIESSVPVFLPEERAVRGDGHVGVYRLNRQQKWEMVTALAVASENKFFMGRPGLHGVFQDYRPPIFQKAGAPLKVSAQPLSKVEGVTFSRWEITPVNLDDLGSGVDTGSIKAMLDGHRLIIEPDLPRDRLLVQWPDSMAVGQYLLHIEAADKAGNTADVTYTIQVQEESP